MPDNEGTPIVPDDMATELTQDQMTLPTKADLEEQNKDDEQKGGEETGKKTVSTDDEPDDGKSGKPSEDTPDDEAGEPAVRETVLPEAPLTDPGAYTPTDQYNFEVVTYDEKGEHPKTHKIKSVEDFETLLENDPNFGSGAAMLKAQRLATKMELGLERDKAAHDEAKEEYTEQTKAAQEQQQNLQQLVSEIAYLTAKGDLPPVAKKYQQADWTDPEVAKQPGVKEQLALLDYMKKENAQRAKAGVRPISSIVDAFNQYDREQAKATKATEKQQQGEQRKQAGSKVSGPSASPVNMTPKNVMVGRNLGSLDNLDSLL